MPSRLLKLKHWSALANSWEYTPVCFLILMVLILHFGTIMQPTEGAFDEHYYVPAAKEILSGDGLGRIEHPPLGQAIVASGIGIFGDNPMGWRFFSVIFGAISLFLFYLICRQLKLSKYTSILAVFLLAIDNLTFVASGVAMLEIFTLNFMFLSFWLYLKGKYQIVGFTITLAALCKMTGVLALLAIIIHWAIEDRQNIKRIILTAVISIVSFFFLLSLIDLSILHRFINPITQIKDMMSYTVDLTFTAYYNNTIAGMTPTRPWEWLYHLGGPGFATFNYGEHQFSTDLFLIINPAIWILILPSIAFLIYKAIKRYKPAIFLLCWFTATYLIWIPASIITDRLTYDYYLVPTVGVICAGISIAITRILNIRAKPIFSRIFKLTIPIYLGITLLFFVSLYTGSTVFLYTWAVVFYLIILYYLDKIRHDESTVTNLGTIKTGILTDR